MYEILILYTFARESICFSFSYRLLVSICLTKSIVYIKFTKAN